MDLHAYLQVLRRSWLLLFVVILACVAGSVVATRMQTPAYESSTSLLVTTTEAASPEEETSQRRLAAERASALAQLAGVEPVREAVSAAAARESGLPARAVTDVQATAAGNDPFLGITVRDPNPAWAKAVAQAYPEGMAAALLPLDPLAADAARGLAVLSPANLPVDPVNADPLRNVLLGLLLGAVLGAGLVVLRESLDRQVRDADDIGRELDLPVRGVVPQGGSQETLPVRSSPLSARAEAYRAVQAALSFAEGRALPRTLLLTSASSGEGVTSVAANVAVALARSGRRVTLVDANMRDPSLHDVLGSGNKIGLAEVLSGMAEVDAAVQRFEQGNLLFLSAGSAPGDPAELLTSRSTAQLLNQLEKQSEVVIIDAPPVLPVADALVLAAQVEAVLLIVRTGRNSRDRIRRARDAVLRVQGPLEGLVVNGAAHAEEQLRPRGRALLTSGRKPQRQPDGRAPAHLGAKRRGGQPANAVAAVARPAGGPGAGAAVQVMSGRSLGTAPEVPRAGQPGAFAEVVRMAPEVAEPRAREAEVEAVRASSRRVEQAGGHDAAGRAAPAARETAEATREAAELAGQQETPHAAARRAAEVAAQAARHAAGDAAPGAKHDMAPAAAPAPDTASAPDTPEPVSSPVTGPRGWGGKPRKVITLRPSSSATPSGPKRGGGPRTTEPDASTGSSPAR